MIFVFVRSEVFEILQLLHVKKKAPIMRWAINLYGLNFRYFYEMQNMSRNTFCEIFSLDVFTGNFTTKMLTMAFYTGVSGHVKPSLDVTT